MSESLKLDREHMLAVALNETGSVVDALTLCHMASQWLEGDTMTRTVLLEHKPAPVPVKVLAPPAPEGLPAALRERPRDPASSPKAMPESIAGTRRADVGEKIERTLAVIKAAGAKGIDMKGIAEAAGQSYASENNRVQTLMHRGAVKRIASGGTNTSREGSLFRYVAAEAAILQGSAATTPAKAAAPPRSVPAVPASEPPEAEEPSGRGPWAEPLDIEAQDHLEALWSAEGVAPGGQSLRTCAEVFGCILRVAERSLQNLVVRGYVRVDGAGTAEARYFPIRRHKARKEPA